MTDYEASEASAVGAVAVAVLRGASCGPCWTARVGVARRMMPQDYRERIRRELALAGLQSTWTLDRFLARRLLASVAGSAAAAVLRLTQAFSGPTALATRRA